MVFNQVHTEVCLLQVVKEEKKRPEKREGKERRGEGKEGKEEKERKGKKVPRGLEVKVWMSE